tara:strand:+ start:4730 stop:4885 length:156 start_codon:yes stop_codon:yes gene_type:complete
MNPQNINSEKDNTKQPLKTPKGWGKLSDSMIQAAGLDPAEINEMLENGVAD